MAIPSYLLAALHGFFAFSHLKDPAGAIKDMVGIDASSSVARHCIAIIGACHLFIAVLLVMCARLGPENAGHRKCILGIYVVTFVPATVAVQFLFPATGTAPGLLEMPFPVLYVCAGLAIAGLASKKAKSA